jgi:hypothetical protein
MTDSIRKVHFTLPNGATFNAEGSEEHVKETLALFRELLDKTPTAPAKAQKPAGNGHSTDGDSDLPLDRLFTQDDYYGVALTAKPKTDDVDADGVVALLYGFAVLKKDANPTAIMLQRAAEKSGLNTPRLGRVTSRRTEFITESGKKKGKRYGLNNPGMAKAVEILRGILG